MKAGSSVLVEQWRSSCRAKGQLFCEAPLCGLFCLLTAVGLLKNLLFPARKLFLSRFRKCPAQFGSGVTARGGFYSPYFLEVSKLTLAQQLAIIHPTRRESIYNHHHRHHHGSIRSHSADTEGRSLLCPALLPRLSVRLRGAAAAAVSRSQCYHGGCFL